MKLRMHQYNHRGRSIHLALYHIPTVNPMINDNFFILILGSFPIEPLSRASASISLTVNFSILCPQHTYRISESDLAQTRPPARTAFLFGTRNASCIIHCLLASVCTPVDLPCI